MQNVLKSRSGKLHNSTVVLSNSNKLYIIPPPPEDANESDLEVYLCSTKGRLCSTERDLGSTA